VVISHDRYLIERVCDSVWALFGDGTLTNLPGGIDEYLTRRERSAAARAPARGPEKPAVALSGAAEQRAARKELARLERSLDKLVEQEERLHRALAEAATDPERLVELTRELNQVRADKEDTEARWMEVAAAL
jgi:ATP-binding cassette subfamily F protein uup